VKPKPSDQARLAAKSNKDLAGALESDLIARRNLINDATQKALERFDETLRELALRRYLEFEVTLGPQLTRFAVAETVRRMRDSGKLAWPAALAEPTEIDRLTSSLTAKYGPWLAKLPALEDTTRLAQDVANDLAKRALYRMSWRCRSKMRPEGWRRFCRAGRSYEGLPRASAPRSAPSAASY
jgi:hypothetical protein